MKDFVRMDLSAIEERLAAQLFQNKVSRRDLRPILYGMAFGMSAKKLYQLISNYPVSKATKLEADILIFERWQNENVGRIRRENATIAYAAVEAGIISPETGMEAVRAVGAKFPPEASLTPTGRRWSTPEIQWEHSITGRYSARPGNVTDVDKGWKPGDAHSYPEDGILRD